MTQARLRTALYARNTGGGQKRLLRMLVDGPEHAVDHMSDYAQCLSSVWRSLIGRTSGLAAVRVIQKWQFGDGNLVGKKCIFRDFSPRNYAVQTATFGVCHRRSRGQKVPQEGAFCDGGDQFFRGARMSSPHVYLSVFLIF